MNTITLTALLIVLVGIAVACPGSERRGRITHPHSDDGGAGHHSFGRIGHSPRHRSYSPERYMFSAPHAQYISQDDMEYLPAQGRRYRIVMKNLRQEEESEEDDDVADDNDEDQEEEDEPQDDHFDTPSWEKLFPRGEQGAQGGPPPSGGYDGGPQEGSGHQHSSGGNGGRPQGGRPPPSGGQVPSFGGAGREGRTGTTGHHKQIRPVTVRIVQPRQYNTAVVRSFKKSNSWPAHQSEVYSRQQYRTVKNSLPLPYQQTVHSQPIAARRWGYQSVQPMPKYVHQGRAAHYRRSSHEERNVLERQQRNKH